MIYEKNKVKNKMKLQIGFIGLGTMGKGMVKNLLKNDYKVVCYNRTKEKGNDITHENFSMVDNPSEVCPGSAMIFTCVTNDEALNEILFEKNGIFQTLNSDNILVDSSTTSIEFTQKIYEECDKRYVSFFDAPITGSKLGAENGTLMFMYGGDKNLFEKCKKVFVAMGQRFVHCGKNTYGQRAKISLNLVQSLIMQSYYESVILALKNGVPLNAILEIFDNSGAKNVVASVKNPSLRNRDFSVNFKLELMRKDLHLADNEIKKLDLNLPLSKQISKVYDKAYDMGLGQEDFLATIKLLEKESGKEIRE
jgi:3-hydroxyisobutyrate dehydrogenase-like beta-hydroxyacid dehydrogenase